MADFDQIEAMLGEIKKGGRLISAPGPLEGSPEAMTALATRTGPSELFARSGLDIRRG